MARPKIEGTDYRMAVHNNGGHMYASTQPRLTGADGKSYSRRIHWGTLDGNMRFHPNARFILLDRQERERFTFPEGWDLSELEKVSAPPSPGRPKPVEVEADRLYGDIWLLERIGQRVGLRQDLLSVFDNNRTVVDYIMTVAMYLVTTGHSCSRIARWQRIEKTPAADELTPVMVTRLMQSITEKDRMTLVGLRRGRLKDGELCAVDSTSRSAYGDSLADIRWGKNKEGLALPQTNEMVVYGLESHMPVYYRQFPGNMPDSRTLDTLLCDLDDTGFGLIPIITDRGYESIANLERLIARGRPFVSAMRTSARMVYDRIVELGDYAGRPEGMEIDRGERIYFRQWGLDYPVTAANGRRVDSDRLRLNLYFNPVCHAEALVSIDVAVSSQREMLRLAKDTGLQVSDPTEFMRQCCYFTVTLDESGKVDGFRVDDVKIAKARRTAGFFCILTHKLDFDPTQAREAYSRRDEQEKYYQQMKTMLGNNRQRNWSEEGKAGSQFILFVGLTLSSYLRYVWKSTELKKKFSSALEILDEMRSVRCVQHPGHHPRVTPFVGKQRDICKAFGFEIPAGCGVEYKSRKILEKKRGRPPKVRTVTLD